MLMMVVVDAALERKVLQEKEKETRMEQLNCRHNALVMLAKKTAM